MFCDIVFLSGHRNTASLACASIHNSDQKLAQIVTLLKQVKRLYLIFLKTTFIPFGLNLMCDKLTKIIIRVSYFVLYLCTKVVRKNVSRCRIILLSKIHVLKMLAFILSLGHHFQKD